MRLRKLIIATHRDVGYVVAGLTVMYAVSGIAVNHIEDWNPNYVVSTETLNVGTLPTEAGADDLAVEVLRRLEIVAEPRSALRLGPDQLKVFLDNRTLTVSLPDGTVRDERATRRAGFFHVNYLHLNHGKGVWTWLADAYAVALLVLAGTGIFIITGKKGLGGRGRWLLLAGLALPLVYLVVKLP